MTTMMMVMIKKKKKQKQKQKRMLFRMYGENQHSTAAVAVVIVVVVDFGAIPGAGTDRIFKALVARVAAANTTGIFLNAREMGDVEDDEAGRVCDRAESREQRTESREWRVESGEWKARRPGTAKSLAVEVAEKTALGTQNRFRSFPYRIIERGGREEEGVSDAAVNMPLAAPSVAHGAAPGPQLFA